jgi:hypothetical protein
VGTRDKFEQVAASAEYAVLVVGNLATSEFELLELWQLPADDGSYTARGLSFLGIIGIVHGQPQVALQEPLEERAMLPVSEMFCKRIEGAVALVERAMTQDPGAMN